MRATILEREADKPPSFSWSFVLTLSALVFAAFFVVSFLLDRSWLADVGLVLAYPGAYAISSWQRRRKDGRAHDPL